MMERKYVDFLPFIARGLVAKNVNMTTPCYGFGGSGAGTVFFTKRLNGWVFRFS